MFPGENGYDEKDGSSTSYGFTHGCSLRSRRRALERGTGERVVRALENDHGEKWRGVLERNAKAWLALADLGPGDLYGGRLAELAVPSLFIDGGRDPRTEPGDPEAVRRALPKAEMRILEGAGHSPHSERAYAEECTQVAVDFLNRLQPTGSTRE